MTPIDHFVNKIRETFAGMSEEELQVEFLTQMWVAALHNKEVIRKDPYKEMDGNVYFFVGAEVQDETIPGVAIEPKQYYNEALSLILIDAIDRGYVCVVDIDGQGNFAFKNSHEIDADDFFVHSKSRDRAKTFVMSLVDDANPV